MKLRSLTIFILFIGACQTSPIETKEIVFTDVSSIALAKGEEQIAKDLVQGAFDHLWAGVDSTQISTYHTDDFVILEQGVIWDNDRIKQFMRNQLKRTNPAKRTNRMEYISIEKYGKSMQIAYFNYAQFTQNDSIVREAKWLESALAVKTKDGWRLKMMHSTGVED